MNSASFAEHVADKPLPLEKPTVTKTLRVSNQQLIEALNHTYPGTKIPGSANFKLVDGVVIHDGTGRAVPGVQVEWAES